jgi:FkbM family methyltransferase
LRPKFILMDIFWVAFRLWSQDSAFSKISLLFHFLKFRIKASYYKRFPLVNSYTEHVFANRMTFSSYDTFLYSFKELFITQIYRFQTAHTHPIIIDCGSNIGMSVLFFKLLYPSSTILAFEPEPQNVSLLQHNVAINHWQDVHIYPMALSNEAGVAMFRKNNLGDGSLKGSLLPLRGNEDVIQVPTVLLSAYVEQDIAMVKMDIEGAEMDVIQELIAANKFNHIQQLIVEYHQIGAGKHREGLASFIDLLKNNNHTCNVLLQGDIDYSNQVQDVLLHSTLLN